MKVTMTTGWLVTMTMLAVAALLPAESSAQGLFGTLQALQAENTQGLPLGTGADQSGQEPAGNDGSGRGQSEPDRHQPCDDPGDRDAQRHQRRARRTEGSADGIVPHERNQDGRGIRCLGK